MSKKQSIWLELKKLKSWIKKNKIQDVYIFGSLIRGNLEPKDIDFCILIKEEDEKKALNLISSLSKQINLKSHISLLTEKDFIRGNNLAKTLIEEGFSIIKNKPLSEILGYKSKSMFIYSLVDFNKSKRVKFHYALNGRYKNKGVLKEVNGERLADRVILVPIINEDIFKKFLDLWNIEYKIERILI